MSMPTIDSGKGNSVAAIDTPTNSGEMDHDDVIEFLGSEDEEDTLDLGDKSKAKKSSESKDKDEEDEDKQEDVEVGEESEEKSEEEDELEDLEKELEPPTEEQLELVTPVRRREILAKYPNLFKDFPYLEKAYYREQQFTELLPTIDDAKTAVEKAQTLDKFEVDVIQGGNTENILKAVKEENPEAFLKLVDAYLPTLARVDEKAYLHVIGNVAKHTIISMVQEARRSGNEALQSAAQILNQFIFGSSEFSPPSNLAKPDSGEGKKNDEIDKRQKDFIRQQFQTVVSDLDTRVNNTLRNTIEANIDPKKSMTDFVRRHASREALEELGKLIGQDARLKALADKLWQKCVEENFSKSSVDKVKSAYLAKAKTLLPTVIKKARNEALRGMGKRVSSDDSNDKSPITPGRPHSQQSSGKVRSPKDIPKDMKTLDFLMQD